MKEAFDPPTSASTTPPEIEEGTSSCMRNNIRNDVIAERDTISSHRPWDSMKREEDTHFVSRASRDVSLLDYQARSSESNYATSIGSHAYSKEVISPRSEHDRPQPYFPLSSCSWENCSSALEAVPSSTDASGHEMAKMRTKSNTVGPWPDYVASYPTTGPHMGRSYPVAAKVDVNLDYHSEHQYKGSDRFTAFANCNGQSIKHGNEIVDLPRGAHCADETSRWRFDSGRPSLPRGLPYGDEIPSLSTQKCNGNEVLSHSSQRRYGAEVPSLSSRQGYGDEIPSLSTQKCNRNEHSSQRRYGAEVPSLSSRQGYGDEIPSLSTQKCNSISRSSQWHYGAKIPSFSTRQGYGDEIPSLSTQKCTVISRSSQWQYGAEIPSLSSRQGYGDEIPSLSRHWRYRDNIPLYSGQRFHDAEAHRLPSYQQGASHVNGHSRGDSVSSLVSNQHAKIRHTITRPRVANRFANSTDHCRFSKQENLWRNSEDIRDQVRGPRVNKSNDASTPTTKKDIMSPLVRRDQFNRSDFAVQYEHAKFFMIKSYSEDDIHKGIKYNVWASTPTGNDKLDSAFHEAQILMKEKGTKCPVFLLFSVNTSGQFVGLAEMLGPVDFKKTMDFWQEDKWNGFFPVIWHIIKDIPNRLFKHITLENNDNRPVTFSRDTQEIGLPQGLEVLKIFKAYRHGTSILDDFDFYEEKENTRCARKGINVNSLHEGRLSYFGTDDLKSMGNLEASMESMSFYETWD